MGKYAAFLKELDALEDIHVRLAEIAKRTDDSRKHDLVSLRRELSQKIAMVGKSGDAIFEAAADSETAQAYRWKFSKMRSSTAIHQAEWPAVRLGEAVSEHVASTREVRDANRDFITWVRKAIAAME